MREDTQHKNTSEEVDLSQLLKLIGNWFSKLFEFIGTLLQVIFNLIIQCILFVRRHIIKFIISAALGVGIGFFLDRNEAVIYSANLVVKPNFGSAQQLYKNIQYYNNLISQRDTILLASTFKITPEEAASIQSFFISPVGNENNTLEAYNRFLNQAVDSTIAEKYDYEDFKKNVANYDYSIHTVEVRSLKNNVFAKLQAVIIESIKENSYFNTKRQVILNNLERSDSILKKSIVEIDSLRNVYMEVLLAEANRESPQGGTSIMLSDKAIKTNELELFNTKIRFKNELNDNEVQRAENLEVVNVISNFQPVGYRVNVVYKKYMFILGLAGFGLMFLYLILKELNTFLNAYQRKNEA